MSSTGAKAPISTVLQVPPGAFDSDEPIIIQPLPFKTRMWAATRLWLLKALVYFGLRFLRLTSRSRFQKVAPTYLKSYQVRPNLTCRVFLPKSYQPGSKLPLYIDIHGGGFALCDPQVDDEYCRHFADKYGFCVVSINYRKAPIYPWPIPVHDCAELTRAVLKDEDLPVNHNKVVMGGFSAGGNLCLAIAQLDGIRERVKGLIPVYPSVDFSIRFRGEFLPNPQGKADVLKYATRLFNWAYVPVGTNRRHNLLSPIYASRNELPQKIFFVGAQYDILCREANIMAKKLAGINFDEASDPGVEWSQNGIRWEQVPDVQHGFTHVPGQGEKARKLKKLSEDLYGRIDEWIKNEVFSAS